MSGDASDDESQDCYQDIIDLLLVGGYFRARLADLTPFDKIVGGFAWAVTCSSEDIDLDYSDQLSLGQKIAVAEKVIKSLRRMKCPYPLHPNQIQGLDYDHLLPVFQWLIKKVIEVREESFALNNSILANQFRLLNLPWRPAAQHLADSHKAQAWTKEATNRFVPRRKYKKKGRKHGTEERMVTSTLVEYGFMMATAGDSSESDDEEEREKEMEELLERMVLMDDEEKDIVAQGLVNSIVAAQKQAFDHDKDQAGEDFVPQLSEEELSLRAHRRQVAALQEQISQMKEEAKAAKAQYKELQEETEEKKEEAEERTDYKDSIVEHIEKLEERASADKAGDLAHLSSLLEAAEKLKRQENEFMAQCKADKKMLKSCIVVAEQAIHGDEAERAAAERVESVYTKEKSRLDAAIAEKNDKSRTVAGLMRRVDEVPTRTELAQYKMRFTELYELVERKLVETRKYYSTYNNLDDSLGYINKELRMMQSIKDNFSLSLKNSSSQERFMSSLNDIVTGFQTMLAKAQAKLQIEREERNELSERFLKLQEKERLYYSTVKAFQDACKKNELLSASSS